MRCSVRLPLVIVALCLATTSFSSGQETAAKTELDAGAQAYKEAKYESAIAHFRQAVALDPSLVTSHLYLATACAQQYIPGVDLPDNNRKAQEAIEEFETVLRLNPTRDQERLGMKGMASLYFNMKKFEKAREYYDKVSTITPDDPETYYATAVIDWTQAFQRRMEERKKLNLRTSDSLITSESCWRIQSANEALVKDGIEMLTKAITLRPDYDDAMAYMNLMYRERAEIRCGDRQAYEADLKTADQWVDLTLATKKKKAETSPGPQIDKLGEDTR